MLLLALQCSINISIKQVHGFIYRFWYIRETILTPWYDTTQCHDTAGYSPIPCILAIDELCYSSIQYDMIHCGKIRYYVFIVL